MTDLERIKEASNLLDKLITEYYRMVYEYYGLPRDYSCTLDGTIFEQAKQFKKRFNLDVIEKKIASEE